MRVVVFFLVSILLLFFLVTGMGLFFPARVTVSRATDISASPAMVYKMLSDPARWKQWFPGAEGWSLVTQEGPSMGITTPNGNTLTIVPQNDSTILVKGLQTASIEGDMGFRLMGGQRQGVVTLQWYMNFIFDWYPWERFSSLLLEKKFGAVMEQGLRQIQQQIHSDNEIN